MLFKQALHVICVIVARQNSDLTTEQLDTLGSFPHTLQAQAASV
jgi:hypothetical protein